MITEVAFLMFLALIVFGPKKTLEMGQTLGRMIAKIKQAASQLQSELHEEVQVRETEAAPLRLAEAAVPAERLES